MGQSHPSHGRDMGRTLLPMGVKAFSLPAHGIPILPMISHDTKVYN